MVVFGAMAENVVKGVVDAVLPPPLLPPPAQAPKNKGKQIYAIFFIEPRSPEVDIKLKYTKMLNL
jgi:hypothetical protein